MSRAPASEPRAWLFGLFSLLVVACVYAPVLGGPLLWDDTLLIGESDRIQNLDWGDVFLRPFWVGSLRLHATAIYYRPLTTLSFVFDHGLHGDNPAGYHLSNLLVHLAACGLVFALLRRRSTPVVWCFLLTTCWGLLPRLTEGAGWISGRADVLSGACVLAALWVYRQGSLGRLVLASALGFLAVLAKELGAVVFLALLLLELSPTGRRASGSRSGLLARLALLSVGPAVYVALRFAAGALATGSGPRLALGTQAVTSLEALGRYAVMLVEPFQPRSLLGRVGSPDWWFVALGGVVLLLACYFAPRLKRLDDERRTFVIAAGGSLLLVLHLVRLPITFVVADRYLYLPTALLVLAVAPWLVSWAERRRFVVPLALLLTVACGARTAMRASDYGDAARFWSAAVQGAPRDPVGWLGAGSVAYQAGLFPEAFKLYSKALALGDTGSVALDNTALLAAVSGQRELAARLGDRLLQQAPEQPAYQLRRATIAFNALDLEGGRRHALRALELAPELGAARELLGALAEAQRVGSSQASVDASVMILTNMRALRYAELVEATRQQLAHQTIDDALLQRAVEFVVAKARPADAGELCSIYVRTRQPANAQQLSDAIALRLATAASLRSYLADLPSF